MFSARLGLLVAPLLVSCAASRPALVTPEPLPGAAPTFFAGVAVFDGTGDRANGPLDVLVQNGRIARMGPAGTLTAPPGALRIEGTGQTLLPGLIDVHAHIGGGDGEPLWDIRLPNARAQLEALLYSGVTSVLSPAHDADTETLAAQLSAGVIPGPFLYRSTRMITARGGHPVPLYWEVVPAPWPVKGLLIGTAVREVTTADEAREAVAGDVTAFAPEFVKVVYDSFPPGSPHMSKEVLAAAVAEARRLGRRVLVHVGTANDAVEAAEAGASMLAHVPRQHRFTAEEARRIAATGVPFVPTVGVFLELDRQFNQRRDFTRLEREVMKPSMETSFASRPERFPIKGFPANFAQLLPEIDRVTAENVRKLREAGAPMLVGSDAGLPGVFHGPGMHEEMKKLVELGIPAAEVLRAATSAAAKWLDPTEKFGVIAEGARADLLLVNGDPLADIGATQRIAGVWKGGHRVRRLAPPAGR